MDYIMQEMPDLQKTGEKKYYPKVKHVNCIPHKTIVSWFMTMTNMSRHTIEGVMSELPDALNAFLSNGHSVKIEGFGTFDLILGQLSEEDIEDVEARKKVGANQSGVYIKKINFSPDREWLNDLRNSTTLHQVPNMKEHLGVSSTMEERLRMALESIEKNGYMQIRDYTQLTGLSRSKATRELKAFCAAPNSGIRTDGNGSHKVFVKR